MASISVEQLEEAATVELKGVAAPVALFLVRRGSTDRSSGERLRDRHFDRERGERTLPARPIQPRRDPRRTAEAPR
jgi:hypothetical protein